MRRPALALAAPPAVALLALVAVLVAAGGAPGATPDGLPDAGLAVRWSVPAARVLLDLSAIATVGSLLVAAVLARASAGAARAIRSGAAWAGAWAATALAAAVLTASEVTGLPLARLPRDQLVAAVWALPPTRALLLVAALATTVLVALAVLLVVGVPARARGAGAGVALALALVALTPPLYAGHAAQSGAHDLATGSLVVHVVAATVWIGGLAGIAVLLRADDAARVPAVTRFSTLALVCFCALIATGAMAAAAGLGTTRESWTSPYAAVLGGKVAAAVVLGLVGWLHRRWTIDRLRAGRPHAFTQLAAVELTVMGAAVGMAVALSRTPGATSNGFLGRAIRGVGPGENLQSLSLADVLGDWRPEPIVSAAVLIALLAYVRAVRAAAERGVRRPARLTRYAVGATALAVFAAGLPTSYDGRGVLALQAGQFLILAVAAAGLAVAARPGELARPGRGSSSGRDWWSDLTADPTTGVVVLLAVAIGVLLSPLRSLVAANAPLRALVLAGSIGAGAVCWQSVQRRLSSRATHHEPSEPGTVNAAPAQQTG